MYGRIGSAFDERGNYVYGISGQDFANEMQYLERNCDKIAVRINSVGGSVWEAYSIVSAIINSKVECNTFIDGLAASSAGLIAVAGKKCTMKDYGIMMLHNPEGGDDKKVLGLVKDTLVTILSNRTKKTPEEISAMMEKETWLSAAEALQAGMVDAIENTGKKIKGIENKTPKALNEVAEIFNQLTNPKPTTMLKITNKLGLNENASEEAVVSIIEKKDAEIADLKNRLEAIQKEKAEKEKADNEAKETEVKNKATAFANKAKEDGKISEEEVADITNLAITNFALAEKTVAMRNPVKKATKVFDPKNVVNGDKSEDRSAWTFQDWSKKDPKGLQDIQNESPEYFKELVNKLPKNLSPVFTPIPGVNC